MLLLGFPGGCSVVKNPPAKAGDAGSIPGLGRSPGEGNDNLLQYSWLGNSMERGAWRVLMVKIQTELEFIVKKKFLFDPVPDLPKLSSLEYTCSELCYSFSLNFFLSFC